MSPVLDPKAQHLLTFTEFMASMVAVIKRIYKKLAFALTSDPPKTAQLWREQGMRIGEGTYIYHNVAFGRSGKDPIAIGRNCVLAVWRR
jgi:hypothetical protein